MGDDDTSTTFPRTQAITFGPEGLRGYAYDIRKIWGEYADSDVIEMANAVHAAMNRLADRIERGE